MADWIYKSLEEHLVLEITTTPEYFNLRFITHILWSALQYKPASGVLPSAYWYEKKMQQNWLELLSA